MYTALFKYSDDGSIIRLTDDMVVSPEILMDRIKEPVVFMGDGVYVYRDMIMRHLSEYAYFAPVNLYYLPVFPSQGWGCRICRRVWSAQLIWCRFISGSQRQK